MWSRQRSSNKGSGAGMSLAGSQEQQLQRKASAAPGSELGRVQAGLSLEKAAGSTYVGHRGCLSPGCCSRTPQTGCLNNRHLVLTVLEKVLQTRSSVRALFLASKQPPSPCVLTGPFLGACTWS